jgi:hypothetical protein
VTSPRAVDIHSNIAGDIIVKQRHPSRTGQPKILGGDALRLLGLR